MNANLEKIQINGDNYVREDSIKMNLKENVNGLKYVIIRGDRSGVFAGFLKERNGREVILLEARRIWYWLGAASISQLAIDGVANPESCKFPEALAEIEILDVIEVVPCTDKAYKSITKVPVWMK